jgi:HAD superfamily hydrolase (TIGR01459 family)
VLGHDQKVPSIISGLGEVVDGYDGFLVDLWGCVHNGIEPFPDAVAALQKAAAMGKIVCLLSNGPRRASALVERLDGMGVPRTAYHHVMSSGEAAWRALDARDDPFHAALGRRCYRLGPIRDASVHEGNGLTLAQSIGDADFILCTGIFDNSDTVSDYEPMLREAQARRLPMVCANPDLVVHIGDALTICAGSLAQYYQSIGGAVAYHGKPFASVYHQCFRLTGIADASRLLAIGDGIRTDVKGANMMGIDSLFLTNGIHSEEMPKKSPYFEAVCAVLSEFNQSSTYAAPRLRW